MVRERIEFIPKWQGEIEGWATTFINRNLWRVAPQFDFDDLYQDAFSYFLICVERYPFVLEARHFMSLFKTCLTNHVNSTAAKRTAHREVFAYDEDSVEQAAVVPAVADAEREIALMLKEAPPIVHLLLGRMADEKQPLKHRRSDGQRETTNQRLCRIAGIPLRDVRTEVLTWLREGLTTFEPEPEPHVA